MERTCKKDRMLDAKQLGDGSGDDRHGDERLTCDKEGE